LEPGLMIDDRRLRRVFREAHPDLLTEGYWKGMQRALRKGWVPQIEVYPAAARLRPPSRR
jgi:isocitrate dehydrogenase kinase/phosphatase